MDAVGAIDWRKHMRTAVTDNDLIIGFEKLVGMACQEYGIQRRTFMGGKKAGAITAARISVYRQAMELWPHLSLPQFGRLFNRDHTTIMVWKKRIKEETDVRSFGTSLRGPVPETQGG